MSTDGLLQEDGKLDTEAALAALDKYEAEHPEVAPPVEKKSAEEQPVAATKSQLEETVAETEAADAASTGEPPAETEEQDWVEQLSEELGELAATLGLGPDDLRELSGPEELQRLAKIMDQQLYKAAKDKVEAEKTEPAEAEKPPRGPDGKFVKAAEGEPGYTPTLAKDMYDEDLVEEFGKLSQYVEQRVAELVEQRVKPLEELLSAAQAQAAQSQQAQLEAMIDGLGQEDLFGQSDKTVTAAQRKSRQQLLEDAQVLRDGYLLNGREVAWTPALLKRAMQIGFSEQLAAKTKQQVVKGIQQQSKKRLGHSGKRKGLNENAPWTGESTKDPVLLEAYYSMLRENG